MTIGLLLKTMLVALAIIFLGCLAFGLLFDKEWLMYAFAVTGIIFFLCVIALSFIYQNLPQVWNSPL